MCSEHRTCPSSACSGLGWGCLLNLYLKGVQNQLVVFSFFFFFFILLKSEGLGLTPLALPEGWRGTAELEGLQGWLCL